MQVNVVNKYKHKGSGEYIGRGSPLGNPFKIGPMTRDEVVNKYQDYIINEVTNNNNKIINELLRLKDLSQEGELNLICFCAPQKCHGDIIKKILCEEI